MFLVKIIKSKKGGVLKILIFIIQSTERKKITVIQVETLKIKIIIQVENHFAYKLLHHGLMFNIIWSQIAN